MTGDTLFVFGLLLAAIVLFASDRVRPDIVALLVILSLILSGILSVNEAVAGFADPVVLLVAVLFIIGAALVRTGVAYAVGEGLAHIAGDSETRLLVFLMLTAATLGAFMSSTGVVAILMPVTLSIAKRLNLSPGRLLLPLAFAALISGMLTLIATPPNLVVNGELRRAGLEPFGFFSFTPIGLLILAAGIGYFVLLGRRLLPAATASTALQPRQTLGELAAAYGITDRGHRLRLEPGSPLVGQTVAEALLRTRYGVTVVGIERHGRFASSLLPALADTELRPNDILLLVADAPAVAAFAAAAQLQPLALELAIRQEIVQEMGLAEVLLPPQSELIGKTLREAAFRSRHGLSVLAIRHKHRLLDGNLIEQRLAVGDTLLAAGGWKQIRLLRSDPRDFLVLNLPAEFEEVAPARSKALFALLSLVGMIVLMTFSLVPNLVAALLALLALVATRCLSMDDAYKAIDWKSVVLIAGMLPLATALDKTGGVALIVSGLVTHVGGLGPFAMLSVLFVLTSLIGLFISNTATAVVMAPIAIGVAQQLGVSPHTLAMTVAIASSAAFATPISSPVNTMVFGPGHYRFNDYMRVGMPLQLLAALLTVLAVPLFFPLR